MRWFLLIILWALDLIDFGLIRWGLVELILRNWIWSTFLLGLNWSCILKIYVLLRNTDFRSYRLIVIYLLRRFLLLFFLWLFHNLSLLNLRNTSNFRINLTRWNIWNFLTIWLLLRLLHLFDSILDWIIKLFGSVPNICATILDLTLVFLIFFLFDLTTCLLLLRDLLLTWIWWDICQWISGRLNILLVRILFRSLYNILLIRQRLGLILSWLLISLDWVLTVVILACFWWRGKKEGYHTRSHFWFIILYFNSYLYIPFFVNNIRFLFSNRNSISFF